VAFQLLEGSILSHGAGKQIIMGLCGGIRLGNSLALGSDPRLWPS
jgi:hypothetical protein